MTLTVRERADTFGTLRYISVFAMETLARWVPTTPDLEAKVIFGRHIWDFAQHADGLGRRTHELRAAMHYSVQPLAPYQQGLDALRALQTSEDRVAGFYRAFLPDLERRYRRFLDETDPLLDEPSVRVVDRNLADFARLSADAGELAVTRPDIGSGDTVVAALTRSFGAAGDYVHFRPVPPGAAAASTA